MKEAPIDKAYWHIREKILSRIYEPGRRLQTVDLATEIGVSRTPVREALRRLELEGLVDIRARLGASVRQIDAPQYKMLCEMRLALESAAARLAARNANYADLTEIRGAFEEMERLVEAIARDPNALPLHEQLMKQDVRFHYAILNAADNELIRAEVVRLHIIDASVTNNVRRESGAEASRTVSAEKRREILEHHRKIYAAIRDRQPEAARTAMDEHIEDMIQRGVHGLTKGARKDPERLRQTPYY